MKYFGLCLSLLGLMSSHQITSVPLTSLRTDTPAMRSTIDENMNRSDENIESTTTSTTTTVDISTSITESPATSSATSLTVTLSSVEPTYTSSSTNTESFTRGPKTMTDFSSSTVQEFSGPVTTPRPANQSLINIMRTSPSTTRSSGSTISAFSDWIETSTERVPRITRGTKRITLIKLSFDLLNDFRRIRNTFCLQRWEEFGGISESNPSRRCQKVADKFSVHYGLQNTTLQTIEVAQMSRDEALAEHMDQTNLLLEMLKAQVSLLYRLVSGLHPDCAPADKNPCSISCKYVKTSDREAERNLACAMKNKVSGLASYLGKLSIKIGRTPEAADMATVQQTSDRDQVFMKWGYIMAILQNTLTQLSIGNTILHEAN